MSELTRHNCWCGRHYAKLCARSSEVLWLVCALMCSMCIPERRRVDRGLLRPKCEERSEVYRHFSGTKTRPLIFRCPGMVVLSPEVVTAKSCYRRFLQGLCSCATSTFRCLVHGGCRAQRDGLVSCGVLSQDASHIISSRTERVGGAHEESR